MSTLIVPHVQISSKQAVLGFLTGTLVIAGRAGCPANLASKKRALNSVLLGELHKIKIGKTKSLISTKKETLYEEQT
jgi:hypothetical protein